MDLRTFVRECLEQIAGAVADAQESSIVQEAGATINPVPHLVGKKIQESSIYGGDWYAQAVDFDVAVTAQEGAGTKATIGVVAGIFGAGGQGTLSQERTSVTRIRFTVPIALKRSSWSEKG